MRRLRVRSFEDMLKAPKGEWFEMPEGLDLDVLDLTKGERRIYRRGRLVSKTAIRKQKVAAPRAPTRASKSKKARGPKRARAP